jgi:hypothetical protein
VIAIIGVLAALVAAAVFFMVGGRQARNTEATIKVTTKLLNDRWKSVIESAKKESPMGMTSALAGGDAKRAQVIWIKVRLMEAFPEHYSDVQTPAVLQQYIPANKFKSYFAKYQTTLGATAGGGSGERSACLLMALKTLNSDSGVAVQDQLNYAIADSDGDGIPEIIDAWGQALTFERFATFGPVQQANPASPGSRAYKFSDPIDPDGTLMNTGWYNTPWPPPPSVPTTTMGKKFESDFRYSIARDPVNAAYVIPAIASLGADGVFPTADDIYSFKLRLD